MNKKKIQKEKFIKIQIENILYEKLYELQKNIITIKNLKISKNIDIFISSLYNINEIVTILNKISNKIKITLLKKIKYLKVRQINFIKHDEK